jgi:hypothetical protein
LSADHDPARKNRRTIRLVGYDYGQAAAYFLTLCVSQRDSFLGMIRNGTMKRSVLGDNVAEEWERTPAVRPNIVLDAFVMMPNHLHAVLMVTEAVTFSTWSKAADDLLGDIQSIDQGAQPCAPTNRPIFSSQVETILRT